MVTYAIKQLKIGFVLLVLMSILTGLIYPLVVTVLGNWLFPREAMGSLIFQDGKLIGSELIGQYFDTEEYFWGRPSATTPNAYNGANSSGSNMGPSNPDFLKAVQKRIQQLQKVSGKNNTLIPVDLVTASGSGLDADISLAAAFYQVPRIAKVRHIKEADLNALIIKLTQNAPLGILGESRVNVLALNLALNDLRSAHGRAATESR